MLNTPDIEMKPRPAEFLLWLLNRLKFKHKEQENIVYHINDILNNYVLFPKKVPIQLIDSICKKHYPDFDMQKSPEMNMGYTDSERMQIRNLVLDILSTAIESKA